MGFPPVIKIFKAMAAKVKNTPLKSENCDKCSSAEWIFKLRPPVESTCTVGVYLVKFYQLSIPKSVPVSQAGNLVKMSSCQ